MAAKKKAGSKKKTVSRKKTVNRKSQKPVISNEVKKILVGIAILVSVCLTTAMIADLFFHPDRRRKIDKKVEKPLVQRRIKPIQEGISPVQTKKTVAGLKGKSHGPIKYEVFKDIDHTIIEKPILPVRDKGPKIAIIIDDIGYDKKIALAFCDLNSDITFSVLPFSPFGTNIAGKLHSKGSQIMLHLPMEPDEYPRVDPGPGAILSDMPPDLLLAQLRKNIRNVPYIVGVNNHMGSKLTTHADQINQIFTILRKKNLFFIDSRTASNSQCKASARLLALRFAQRDVFLDNVQDTVYITGQFKKLLDLAKKHGTAIGIGHPYKATLQALSTELPKLKNTVEIVRAGSLTAIPG